MKTYRLYSYDVWGNAKDGYEVNDVFKTSETYNLNPNAKDIEIIIELQKQGAIKKGIRRSLVEIDGDDETIYFNYKGRPEFELRLED